MPQNILAIDAALKTGWCHTIHSGGTWENPGKEWGERLAYFADWLDMILRELPTDMIYYEKPFFRGKISTQLAWGWMSEIERLAHCHECGTKQVQATSLKLHATGRGHASKQEMLEAAMKQNPTIQIVDDNHCDSLWLLHYASCN